MADDVRGELAAAIHGHMGCWSDDPCPWCETLADALLPVVDRIARECAAEELRADDETRSRIYGWLSDRTSRADGSEWEHGALRVAVDELFGIIK